MVGMTDRGRLGRATGAGVDVVDRHGNTPLWRAVFCSRGEDGTIRLLLEAGADPDRDNVHGLSPRTLAGRIANYDVAVHLPAGDDTYSCDCSTRRYLHQREGGSVGVTSWAWRGWGGEPPARLRCRPRSGPRAC
ncbi:hypothetical protein ACWDE0_41840 [Streptomyces sp. 900105755]